jgi:hypothetical protein
MAFAILVVSYLLVGFVVSWYQKVENLVPVVTAVVTWPAAFFKNFKI